MNVSSPFSMADLYFFLLGRPQSNLKKGCYLIFFQVIVCMQGYVIVFNPFECKHTINCMGEQKIIANKTPQTYPFTIILRPRISLSTLFHLCFCSQMPSQHYPSICLATHLQTTTQPFSSDGSSQRRFTCSGMAASPEICASSRA